MTDAPELEKLFDPIRQAMADMEARALRFGHIEATIRVNAMRHGATNEQIEDFISGRAEFISWLAEKVERPDPRRVAALVKACMAWGMHIAPEDATAADPFRDIRAALAAFKGGADG